MRFDSTVIAHFLLGAALAFPSIHCRAQNENDSGPAPASSASSATVTAIAPDELHQLAGQSARNPEALGRLLKLCESGNGQACHYAALLYSSSKTGMLNLENATSYFQKGCDAGFAKSCVDAGWLYLSDTSVIKRNNRRAFDLMKQGCGLNEMQACYLEGWLYVSLPDFNSNTSAAMELFWKACDGGYGKACFSLAQSKNEVSNQYRDPVQANRLYRLACFTGEPEACKKYSQPELPADAPPGSRQLYAGPHAAIYAMPGSLTFVVRAESLVESSTVEQAFLHTLPCEPSGRWEPQKQSQSLSDGKTIDTVTAKCSTSKRTRDFRFDIGSVVKKQQ